MRSPSQVFEVVESGRYERPSPEAVRQAAIRQQKQQRREQRRKQAEQKGSLKTGKRFVRWEDEEDDDDSAAAGAAGIAGADADGAAGGGAGGADDDVDLGYEGLQWTWRKAGAKEKVKVKREEEEGEGEKEEEGGTEESAEERVVREWVEREVHLGAVPVMLRSDACHLNGLSEKGMWRKEECPKDRGGYFIVKGMEKVVIPQLVRAPNTILVEPAPPLSSLFPALFPFPTGGHSPARASTQHHPSRVEPAPPPSGLVSLSFLLPTSAPPVHPQVVIPHLVRAPNTILVEPAPPLSASAAARAASMGGGAAEGAGAWRDEWVASVVSTEDDMGGLKAGPRAKTSSAPATAMSAAAAATSATSASASRILQIHLPYFSCPVNLFLFLRALGVRSDKEIFEMILGHPLKESEGMVGAGEERGGKGAGSVGRGMERKAALGEEEEGGEGEEEGKQEGEEEGERGAWFKAKRHKRAANVIVIDDSDDDADGVAAAAAVAGGGGGDSTDDADGGMGGEGEKEGGKREGGKREGGMEGGMEGGEEAQALMRRQQEVLQLLQHTSEENRSSNQQAPLAALESLTHNNKLSALDLPANDMLPHAALASLESLTHNNKLSALDLPANDMLPHAALASLESLTHNNKLSALDLPANDMVPHVASCSVSLPSGGSFL
ncbi:unnamed protein product [Closterium sp. NIES-64]|nr:unnamed protein product [Closterium sp. NIES-64]